MIYEKKLLLAKILVSVGLCVFVLVPIGFGLGANHMPSVQYGHLIALPIMLWAIWGRKLHGTGRSVRLMAFIGIAFTLGFFIAAALGDKLEANLHDPGLERLIFGMDNNMVMNGTILVLLVLGVFLSIRQGSDAK